MRCPPSLAGAFALTLVMASPVAAAGPADDRAPTSHTEALAWVRDGGPWRVLRPGDPASPRAFAGTTGPRDGVRSFDAAVRDIAQTGGISFVGSPAFETLEAWTRFDGRTNRITMAPTRLAGRPGVVFMEISLPRGSDRYTFFAIEMPEPVFRAWGGAVRMMVLRQVVPTMDSVPAVRREQVARAPLPQQVAFFEAAQDRQYEALSAGLMMTQAGTFLRMQELNYDLLFGNDITDPMLGTTRKRGG